MTAVARTARKPQPLAARRGAERRPREIRPDPAELSLGLLIDPRRLSRPGALELLRIAAGFSYRDVADLTGIRRAHVMRILRGDLQRPTHRFLDRIRDVCWERLPSCPQNAGARYLPDLVTLEEAARLLAVRPIVMRRLAVRHPELAAIKVGHQIRFPSKNLAAFISGAERPAGSESNEGLSTAELGRALRVAPHVIHYLRGTGRIRSFRRGGGRGGGYRFALAEVRRLMREGTGPLRPRQGDLSRNRRPGGGRER